MHEFVFFSVGLLYVFVHEEIPNSLSTCRWEITSTIQALNNITFVHIIVHLLVILPFHKFLVLNIICIPLITFVPILVIMVTIAFIISLGRHDHHN